MSLHMQGWCKWETCTPLLPAMLPAKLHPQLCKLVAGCDLAYLAESRQGLLQREQAPWHGDSCSFKSVSAPPWLRLCRVLTQRGWAASACLPSHGHGMAWGTQQGCALLPLRWSLSFWQSILLLAAGLIQTLADISASS